MKLTIELVPSTSWYNNLRKVLPKSEWDKIRRKTYSDHNHRCGICQADTKLNCHEIWNYDDENHIQNLDGFIALCNMCHHVKHIGLAGILADQGKLDYDKVVNHFMKVNKCNHEVFLKHRKNAFTLWTLRSSHEWQVDFGDYRYLLSTMRSDSRT